VPSRIGGAGALSYSRMMSLTLNKRYVKIIKNHFKKDEKALAIIDRILVRYQDLPRDCFDGPRNLGNRLELNDGFYSFRFLHTLRRRYVFPNRDGTEGSDTEDDDEARERLAAAQGAELANGSAVALDDEPANGSVVASEAEPANDSADGSDDDSFFEGEGESDSEPEN